MRTSIQRGERTDRRPAVTVSFIVVPVFLLAAGSWSIVHGDRALAAPPKPVTVVGAAGGELKIVSTGPALDATIVLRAAAEPADVRVQVGPLRDTGGEAYPVSAGEPAFDGRLGTVRITGLLPFGGPYLADLVVAHDRVEEPPVTLSVTRTRSPVTVTVEGVATTSAVSYGLRRQTVRHDVVVTETGGRAVTLGPLAVVGASGKQGERSSAADVTVTGLTGSDSCTVDHGTRTVTVPAGQACHLGVDLELPAAPGTYDLAVRFGAPGYAPVDDRVTVQLRRSLPVAAVVIGIGVLAAMGLAVVLRPRRDRQRTQVAISRVRERIRTAGTTAEESAQAEGLHAVLDAVDRLARVDPEQAAAQLTTAGIQVDQLHAWIAVRRNLNAADPPPSEAVRADFERVTQEMIDPNLTEARAKDLGAALERIDKRLVDTAKRAAQAQIKQLRKALGEIGNDEAAPELNKAENALAGETPDVEEALTALNRAQTILAGALEPEIRRLAERDASALGLPVRPGAWPIVQARVQASLSEAATASPADRLTLLRRAERDLFAGTADAFADYIRDKQAGYRAAGVAKMTKLADRFNPILTLLGKVTTYVERGDMPAARTAYDDVVRDWQELSGTLATAGVHLGPGDKDVAAPEAPRGLIVSPIRVGTAPVVERPTPVEAAGARNRTEWILGLFAGAVAVLFGLATLYLGRPTWGGPADLITALLWGLGVTAAAGYAAVQSDLTK